MTPSRLLLFLAGLRAKATVFFLVCENYILVVLIYGHLGPCRSLRVLVGCVAGFLDLSFFFFVQCRILVQLVKFQDHGLRL